MKRLFQLFILSIATQAQATNYYVSAAGSDGNAGTQALPWLTISKVNAATLVAGDSVLFRRGDTFYGALSLKSGNSGAKVVYAAYGTGADPIITGFTTVSAWTSLGGGIWESTSAVSSLLSCNMVAINGVRYAMGRYPNKVNATTDYINIDSFTNNSAVYTKTTIPTNMVGGVIVMKKKHWVLDRNKITSYGTSGTFTIVNYAALSGSATQYNPVKNYGFFIQAHPNTLDTYGEWYYDTAAKKIRVYFGASGPTAVQVSTVDDLVAMPAYTRIVGLQLIGSNLSGVMTNGDYTDVINCTFKFIGYNGVMHIGTRTNTTIQGCNFSFVNNVAISMRGTSDYLLIEDNTLADIGTVEGAGDSGDLGQEAMLTFGSNGTFRRNSMRRIGYTGIRFGNRANNLIENNYIDSFCLVKDDGGAIYTWNNNPNPALRDVASNNIIRNNLIINGIGNYFGTSSTKPEAYGVYIDDRAYNVSVSGNTIYNTYYGIVNHNGFNCTYRSNTVYSNHAGALWWRDRSDITVTGLDIKDNIFYAQNTKNTVRFWDVSGTGNSIPSFGQSDSNYYVYQGGVSASHINAVYPSYSLPNTNNTYSLAGWQAQTIYGTFDQNSNTGPFIATERFEYNSTSTSKVVTLDQSYIDVRGVRYTTGSITLAPYSSAILLPETTIILKKRRVKLL